MCIENLVGWKCVSLTYINFFVARLMYSIPLCIEHLDNVENDSIDLDYDSMTTPFRTRTAT